MLKKIKLLQVFLVLSFFGILSVSILFYNARATLENSSKVLSTTQAEKSKIETQRKKLQSQLQIAFQELNDLKNQDQYKINKELEARMKEIEKTFKDTVSVYEDLVKLRELTTKTSAFDKNYATIITYLSKQNYASASALIITLKKDIETEKNKYIGSVSIPANVPAINTAPGSGYRRQSVQTDAGNFLVDIVAADLNSTRVVVDTASEGTCTDNCPVLSLATYAGRSGAYAAINGPYFCPASYPSCAGKTNSFDTLLMNKNKVYFNSDNNIYSTVPAVIFSGNSARFVGRSLEWGRDTSVDAVIASQPMLVSNGETTFGGDTEAKRSSRGTRSFIGTTGNTVYIGVVHGATVAEVAKVLKTMGVHNALNLDSGGSTAFRSNGRYIAGPGRDTPFGILLLRK